MKLNTLFFHIHYCNGRNVNDETTFPLKISRTIAHHELILITGGKGKITIGEKKYPLKEGMLFYICPDIPHSFRSDKENRMCFRSVHFSFAEVTVGNGHWKIKNDEDRLQLSTGRDVKDDYLIQDLFNKLVESWFSKPPGYEFITKTLLQQLLIAIIQNNRKHHQNQATSLKIEKIITYMHQNIEKKLTLTELSKMVELSATYLSRTFKETTGYSVIAFFNKVKIDKAKELMSEGNKKVKEVAEVLGFTDEFYFSRVFKKNEGISPTDFYSKNVHDV
ncbi:AraC family transcriptional regulator [Acetobacterium woodii]|nr:AraC family transcriptional regulator [Acetobacterium woodii]